VDAQKGKAAAARMDRIGSIRMTAIAGYS